MTQLQLPPRVAPTRRHLLPALFILAVMAGVAIWLYTGRVTSADAVVNGPVFLLEAPFDGRIAAVPVTDGQTAAAGEALIQMDDASLRSAVQEARARLEALDAGVMGSPLSPGAIRAAEQAIMAAMQKARNEEAQARNEYEHQTTLHVQAQLQLRRLESQVSRPPSGAERNAAKLAEIESRASMDAAREALETSSQARAATDNSLRQFRQDLARQQQLALNPEQRLQQRQLQTTWLARAEDALAAATIAAPFPGLVGRLHAAPGMTVRKGQLMGTLTPTAPANLWVDAVIPAAEASRVSSGMKARVDFGDASPPLALNGTVEQLLSVPAAAAGNPGDGTATFPASQQQIFVARIVFPAETETPSGALRMGMKGKAVIFTY